MSCKPTSSRDEARLHQFGKHMLLGIFMGCVFCAGGGWSCGWLIADCEDLESLSLSASEVHVQRFKHQGESSFPCPDESKIRFNLIRSGPENGPRTEEKPRGIWTTSPKPIEIKRCDQNHGCQGCMQSIKKDGQLKSTGFLERQTQARGGSTSKERWATSSFRIPHGPLTSQNTRELTKTFGKTQGSVVVRGGQRQRRQWMQGNVKRGAWENLQRCRYKREEKPHQTHLDHVAERKGVSEFSPTAWYTHPSLSKKRFFIPDAKAAINMR